MTAVNVFEKKASAEHSTPFLNMATRIDRAESAEFGGALVLVAPDGKKIEFMMTNPTPESNLVAFWAFVESVIKDSFNEYQNSGMLGQQTPWPGRR